MRDALPMVEKEIQKPAFYLLNNPSANIESGIALRLIATIRDKQETIMKLREVR